MEQLPPNWLVLRIQPDEGISLQFEVKRPGPVVDLAAVHMDFRYRDWFPREPNVGYETLIYDCMIGDQSCFSVPTWWRKPGASCSRRWMPGPPNAANAFSELRRRQRRPAWPRKKCCLQRWPHLASRGKRRERLSLRGAKRRGCAGRPARGEDERYLTMKGRASQIGPEFMRVRPRGLGRSVDRGVGGPSIEPRKASGPGCRRCPRSGRQHGGVRYRQCPTSPAWS